MHTFAFAFKNDVTRLPPHARVGLIIAKVNFQQTISLIPDELFISLEANAISKTNRALHVTSFLSWCAVGGVAYEYLYQLKPTELRLKIAQIRDESFNIANETAMSQVIFL